jgi:PAS domain S-box-containing protein
MTDGSVDPYYRLGVAYLFRMPNLRNNGFSKMDNTQEQIGFSEPARDVTQAKWNDKTLEDSESRYRSFLEFSPDPIVIYDLNGLAQYLNRAFETTFGWSRNELIGKRIDFVPPDNIQETQNAIQRLMAEKEVTLFETQRFTKKGEILDVQLSSSIYLDPLGNMKGVIVILRDITELKRTRLALAESQRWFSTLVQESPYGISLIDRLGSYQYLNRKFTEIFGYTIEDIPNGKVWFKLAFPDLSERERAISLWKNEHLTWIPGETKPYTRKVRCKDGDYKIISFRPVIMPNGNYFVIHEDITDRETARKRLVKAHKELKKAHEDLKLIERAKEKAVDHICHEIKTPIAIIDAIFKIVSKFGENAPKATFIELIERGQRYLQRLKSIQIQMDDIAIYSKPSEHKKFLDIVEDLKNIKEIVSENNMPVEKALYLLIEKLESIYAPEKETFEELDLADIIKNAIEHFGTSHHGHRNLNILNKTLPGMIIYIDMKIINKVVGGLLRNAIENTPDGGQIIINSREDSRGITIEFIDFGTGITEENQKNLFWGFFHTQDTKYYSTKRPYDFNAGGSGADLLRMKLFADRYSFSLSFKSRRCKYIPFEEQSCPGDIRICQHITSRQDCMDSGGSQFIVAFPKERFSAKTPAPAILQPSREAATITNSRNPGSASDLSHG